jgi:hypothetical protein
MTIDPYANRRALSATPGTPTEDVPCPVCMSAPGQRCTALTADGNGRHTVTWLHEARVPRESYPSRYGVGVADAGEGFGAAL